MPARPPDDDLPLPDGISDARAPGNPDRSDFTAGDAAPAEEVSSLELMLERFDRGRRGDEGYEPVTLVTNQGDIETYYYAPARPFGGAPPPDVPPRTPAAAPGAVFVGGVGEGFDSPVSGRLYPGLCRDLSARGVGCLRVRYRRPGDFEQCVLDVLTALAFLDEQDVAPVALFGHSFGGAVAIHAALLSPVVAACAPLATMPYGADVAEHLGPRCSILIAHGAADDVVPVRDARELYEIASEPKRLLVKEGVGHALDEWADELPNLLRDWSLGELRRAWAAGSPPAG
jgi:hypothetical protein